MSQLREEEILPRELIETIQQYVSGKSIYIPCREKKDWGSQTQSRQYYGMRNHEICEKYKNGTSVVEPCNRIFLIREKHPENHKNNG